MSTLGDRIRNARKAKGITQTQIKELCGISSGNLSEMENNKVSPTANALFSLKRILGVSVDWLLTGEGNMFDVQNSDVTQLPARDIWELKEYQKEALNQHLSMLTEEQAALINNYEKLNLHDKKEIRSIIKMKLSEYTHEISDSVDAAGL